MVPLRLDEAAPVLGVKTLVAPLVRSFPVRLRIPDLDEQIVSRRLGISDLIRSLHAQLTESLEHEHCNLVKFSE